MEYWQAFIDRDLRSLGRAYFGGSPLPSFSGDLGFGNHKPDAPSFHEPQEIFRLQEAAFIAAAVAAGIAGEPVYATISLPVSHAEWPAFAFLVPSPREDIPPAFAASARYPVQVLVAPPMAVWKMPRENVPERHPGIGELPVDTAGGYADSYNMTLELKIRRVGNSLGVIIPTEALALLNVREGDVLFLTEAAEGSVRLSAQRPGFAEKAEIADDLIQRYRNAFNELAK